jgi:nucleotide-binding universal stress UspA family protein
MFSRVLVPLDGSKVGEAAIPVIERLVDKMAAGTKVEVIFIGIITMLRHWVVVGEASAPVSYTEEELKRIKERVTDYLIKTGESLKNKGVSISTIVSSGNAADEIIKAAEVHAREVGVKAAGVREHYG